MARTGAAPQGERFGGGACILLASKKIMHLVGGRGRLMLPDDLRKTPEMVEEGIANFHLAGEPVRLLCVG